MIKIGSILTGQRYDTKTTSIDIDQDKTTICTVTIKSKDQALVTAIEKAVKAAVKKYNK